ncbi:hypothetical protein OUZ56_003600 [Daphnia magna]|uniref:Uncharacterized protein n=1 Tax=Daphnia magna TaxID=35525 RepID=A0ABR0A982_9CRUS|nr:hypothetical protein OUZ56_003600 [Daphnia magna]
MNRRENRKSSKDADVVLERNERDDDESDPSNTLYWADVGPIDILVGNIGQLSRLSSDSQPTI